MSLDEIFVGMLAIAMALMAAAAAAGPWQQPYQLRSVRSIRRRFGKSAARGLFMLVAAVLLAAGTAILCGARPQYALPKASDVNSAPSPP